MDLGGPPNHGMDLVVALGCPQDHGMDLGGSVPMVWTWWWP